MAQIGLYLRMYEDLVRFQNTHADNRALAMENVIQLQSKEQFAKARTFLLRRQHDRH